ncbi:MAG TPA: TetR/AcrR family transcriptional regulator [Allosphingosinicella sp.]|jgi:AcrR family transcriptional regulator
MEQKGPRRPGRPPAYDRNDAIEKAQRLFWKEGAAGVSLDSLSSATGLHKPSLYAAFGGKAGLYAAALDLYIDRGAPDVKGAFERAPLRAALEAFFEADLDVFCAGGEGRGCFLVGTAIQAAFESPEVRSRVEAVFAALRRLIHARLERAAAEGDIGAGTDLEALTEILFATHIALSVEARSGAPRAELRRRYRRVVDFVA